MRKANALGLGREGFERAIIELAAKIRKVGGRPDCIVVDDYGHHCLGYAESVVGLPVKVREWAHGNIHVMSTDDFDRREPTSMTQHLGAGSGQT